MGGGGADDNAAATGVAAGSQKPEQEQQEQDKARAEANSQHKKHICYGAMAASAAYTATYAVVGDSTVTEDIVDLAHSAYTSSVALTGIASMERHPLHTIALKKSLAGENGMVVKMFCHSIGYFFADVALIMGSLAMGKRPNLWQGRLAHHVIQACANLPVIFQNKCKKESLALRSVLCIAYFAEFSNIFLRLSNMLRRTSKVQAQKATNIALVLSFAASRMLNFPVAISVFVQARSLVQPSIFRLAASIQAAGYVLNLAWFAKIVGIVVKQARSVPSFEC
mmetsp:Transcript_41663/g.89451  ORF Transcript_41663/g.89451 Transcript_41663/m.89451 type:complete len:281 (-) Transcript_41663:222-1064(-)|eukprot:CAMPEP_0206435862 /NCGR_PEP_ID=MMETSP0324_2-20121206/10141_1 /ASSEMBLY_ACC=CAM_ASM_000836 /TAXON_ID=2866 /ORGANISM="Crypthecodinium cohnii, Strain Seligo" /LENGTH=280 /DNA_ID=CAMNT_0053902919 /DNA_START=132 /DNA_END=974 /DNA_ORIENTATION=+